LSEFILWCSQSF